MRESTHAKTLVARPREKPALDRRARRAQETRVRLFRAALDLFARHGFFNVTIEEITDAADVGKGTFFNYFKSKDHVLGVMAEIQLGKIRATLEHAKTANASSRTTFHRLALRLVEEPGRSPQLARAVISAFLASDVVRRLLQSQFAVGRRLLAQLAEQGQKSGEIAAELDSRVIAIQFQQAVMGTILLWTLDAKPKLAARIEASFEHFWRAIAAKERGRR